MVPLTVSLTNGGTEYLSAPPKKKTLYLHSPKSKKGVTPSSYIDKKNDKALDGAHKYSVPPFVKDTVNGTIANKVGDNKTWNKKLWYYCDFPNHRNGMRWHKQKATHFKSRLRYLQSNASPPTANLANDE